MPKLSDLSDLSDLKLSDIIFLERWAAHFGGDGRLQE